MHSPVGESLRDALRMYLEPLVALKKRLVARFKNAKDKPYAAIFLDDRSQRELLRWWKDEVGVPLLPDLKAHHMTLKYDPDPGLSFPVGTRASLRVVGWQADEKAQAVAVVPNGVRSHNKHPHVTVAVAAGGSAAYSNQLLEKGIVAWKGPILSGVVDVRTK